MPLLFICNRSGPIQSFVGHRIVGVVPLNKFPEVLVVMC